MPGGSLFAICCGGLGVWGGATASAFTARGGAAVAVVGFALRGSFLFACWCAPEIRRGTPAPAFPAGRVALFTLPQFRHASGPPAAEAETTKEVAQYAQVKATPSPVVGAALAAWLLESIARVKAGDIPRRARKRQQAGPDLTGL